MRIAILTRYFPPAHTDGIPRNRAQYAREFVRLGHEVHVITSGHDGFESVEDGVFVHQVAGDDPRPDLHGIVEEDPALDAALKYSQAVYERLRRLHAQLPLDVIDSPLWELEGYVTSLRMPEVPMVVRLETTSMQLEEIRLGRPHVGGPTRLFHRFEANFLERADALVFDSWSIAREVRRLYRVDITKKLHAVVHHGMELPASAPPPPSGGPLRVLAVGRLEKRKGTDLLIGSILPQLLASAPDVEVHLVGRDNSRGDGFFEATGLDYPAFLRQRVPLPQRARVHVHGFVPDEELAAHYAAAHVVLCLSRYESFGLQYLEAMRWARPIVAFDAGAAPEIFTGDEAVLVPSEDTAAATRAILALLADPARRAELGRAAFGRGRAFSGEAMATRCARFLEQVVATRRHQPRIIQLMDCLIDRDGVSSIAIDYDRLLRAMGYDTVLAGRFAAPEVGALQTPLEAQPIRRDDVVLYHYWNFSASAEDDAALDARKAMVFHNITDPSFFDRKDPVFQATSRGYRQLRRLDRFAIHAAFSQFSSTVLRMTFGPTMRSHLLNPLVDAEALRGAPFDARLVESLRARPGRRLLFVGRVVAHKRQEDLIRLLQALRALPAAPPVELILVGAGDAAYLERLRKLAAELGVADRVAFEGSVTDERLRAYYRGCDAYVSMSEHEGFGLPLVTAMAFDLPVFAFAKGAVGETVGDNGCLFTHKRFAELAPRVARVLEEPGARAEVLARQRQRLEEFQPPRVKAQLRSLIEELQRA